MNFMWLRSWCGMMSCDVVWYDVMWRHDVVWCHVTSWRGMMSCDVIAWYDVVMAWRGMMSCDVMAWYNVMWWHGVVWCHCVTQHTTCGRFEAPYRSHVSIFSYGGLKNHTAAHNKGIPVREYIDTRLRLEKEKEKHKEEYSGVCEQCGRSGFRWVIIGEYSGVCEQCGRSGFRWVIIGEYSGVYEQCGRSGFRC